MKTRDEIKTFFESEMNVLLNSLQEETRPLWGTMDARRMIEHLITAIKIGNGKISIPLEAIDVNHQRFKKISLISDRPLPQGFHNPILSKGLQPYVFDSLDLSKKALNEEIQNLYHYFESDTDEQTCIHNIFGELNYDEWLWFEYKHVTYHFMQFGIIEKVDRIL